MLSLECLNESYERIKMKRSYTIINTLLILLVLGLSLEWTW